MWDYFANTINLPVSVARSSSHAHAESGTCHSPNAKSAIMKSRANLTLSAFIVHSASLITAVINAVARIRYSVISGHLRTGGIWC